MPNEPLSHIYASKTASSLVQISAHRILDVFNHLLINADIWKLHTPKCILIYTQYFKTAFHIKHFKLLAIILMSRLSGLWIYVAHERYILCMELQKETITSLKRAIAPDQWNQLWDQTRLSHSPESLPLRCKNLGLWYETPNCCNFRPLVLEYNLRNVFLYSDIYIYWHMCPSVLCVCCLGRNIVFSWPEWELCTVCRNA